MLVNAGEVGKDGVSGVAGIVCCVCMSSPLERERSGCEKV